MAKGDNEKGPKRTRTKQFTYFLTWIDTENVNILLELDIYQNLSRGKEKIS